ncbi:hypothetical protein CCACVL1_21212 [Corchorus capsularis]|uniref:Uncharacterized protein n=1 Tax=Corchorus capsularis TaxID=210143 RepID=A0A1R3H7H7_COCAP|nr:hypothetical protein CCACVL1_21212 [Corchorus capsularis]
MEVVKRIGRQAKVHGADTNSGYNHAKSFIARSIALH